MNSYENHPPHSSSYHQMEDYEEETPIDWGLYISKAYQNWKKIFWISCLFGLLGIIVALGQKRKYAVSVQLAPELQSSTRSSSLSSLVSMMGMGSMPLQSSPDALNILLFPDICQSTPFLTSLFNVPLTPYVKHKDAVAGVVATPTTLYDHLMGLDKEKGFISQWLEETFPIDSTLLEDDTKVDVFRLTKNQYKALKILRKCISVNVDNKTGVTNIYVVMDDRQMAAQLADTVCARLQSAVFEYRIKKESDNLDYFIQVADEAKSNLVSAQAAYAASVDYNRSVSLQSINVERERLQQEVQLASQVYSQIVQQREMARAKVQEAKPIFAVVESASIPEKPVNSRKKTVFMFGFLGFFLSAGWFVVGKDYLVEFRSFIMRQLI